MATTLSLSKDDYPTLGGLLQGQQIELKVKGNVLDSTDRTVSLGVTALSVTSRSKLSTNEVVQQLAAARIQSPIMESRP